MYNRSEIMKRAWELFRDAYWGQPGYRAQIWSECLSAAWREARTKAGKAKAENIRRAITVLECKTRFVLGDHARLTDLRHELALAA